MTVEGTTYKNECALLLSIKDDYPIFGQIKEIFILEASQVVFHVKHFHTDIFSQHFHAFIIIPTNTYSVVTPSALHHPFTHHIHKLILHDGNAQAIILKHHVSGTLQA